MRTDTRIMHTSPIEQRVLEMLARGRSPCRVARELNMQRAAVIALHERTKSRLAMRWGVDRCKVLPMVAKAVGIWCMVLASVNPPHDAVRVRVQRVRNRSEYNVRVA